MTNNNLATKINLDVGIIKTLDVNNFKNVLVLTGAHYSLKVFNEKVKPLIKTKIHLYDKITPNPTDTTVYNIISFAKDKNIDCILSVGGGAVMDCGRIASFLLSHGGMLHEYLPGGKIGPLGITPNVIYHITVPTIFGSGAELSSAASFIMNSETKTLLCAYLTPKATYLDPDIMKGIPEKLIAAISFDCFANSISAIVSQYANPASEAFAEQSLKGYIESVYKLMKDTNNIEYVKQMVVASINSIIATNLSSRGAIHAIAEVLSARLNLQHGIALAMVCSQVSAKNYDYNKPKYDKVLEIMGKQRTSIKDAIDSHIKKIGLTFPTVKGKFDLNALAQECISATMNGNPKLMSAEDVKEILKSLS